MCPAYLLTLSRLQSGNVLSECGGSEHTPRQTISKSAEHICLNSTLLSQFCDCYWDCDLFYLIPHWSLRMHACSLPLIPHATLNGIFFTTLLPLYLLLLLFSTRYELPSIQWSLVTNHFTSICFSPCWNVEVPLLKCWSSVCDGVIISLICGWNSDWTVCFSINYIVEGWGIRWWPTWNISSHLII